MQDEWTLDSLFDGIGVFPLAGSYHNISPIFASEIEVDAIDITRRHFPSMKHVGDITQLHGADFPPCDLITFGSQMCIRDRLPSRPGRCLDALGV